MKKATIIFSVLFLAISFNSCTSDDFEGQANQSEKRINKEKEYSSSGKVIVIIPNTISNTSEAQATDSTEPIIVIKKD